ncbi:acyl-CoA dehydrogenase family protein, partial [Nocardioides sp.]|uniref:acyl-CoA dehydrogenase family protein n=1 Tax=Nocardioides sp. TaxID=35761 RepID=UPI00271F57A7
MDFSFTPEQDDAAELAAQILGDRATNERQKAVEAEGSRFDADLWRSLDEAGLVSLALPEDHGGAGLGLIELCRVLVEVGRTVAPVPLAVHGPAALLVAEAGTDEQKRRWLG